MKGSGGFIFCHVIYVYVFLNPPIASVVNIPFYYIKRKKILLVVFFSIVLVI